MESNPDSSNSKTPYTTKEISKDQFLHYIAGNTEKSKYELEREMKRKRQKEDNEEADKIYETFLMEFGTDDHEDITFVHGGSVQPKGTNGIASGEHGKVYQPTTKQSSTSPSSSSSLPFIKKNDAPQKSTFSSLSNGKKTGVTFSFKPVMKKKSAATKTEHNDIKKLFSKDDSEDESKNELEARKEAQKKELESILESYQKEDHIENVNNVLYAYNLVNAVTYDQVYSFFASRGHVIDIYLGPVKADKDVRYAFITFKSHEQAQFAKDSLDNKELCGQPVYISWSREGKMKTQNRLIYLNTGVPYVYITPPETLQQAQVIENTASYVSKYGSAYEDYLKSKLEHKKDKELFQFLFESTSENANYYKWCIYTYGKNENPNSYSFIPFETYPGGPLFIPPYIPSYRLQNGHDRDSSSRSRSNSMDSYDEKKKYEELPDRLYNRLQDLLRGITLNRSTICECMGFILDEEKYCFDCLETVKNSIFSEEAWVGTKLARLYVLNDILANCHVINKGDEMRTIIQNMLPEIFDHFNEVLLKIESKIEREEFKKRMTSLFEYWEDNNFYSSKYINGLEMLFYRKPEDLSIYEHHLVDLVEEFIPIQKECDPLFSNMLEKKKSYDADSLIDSNEFIQYIRKQCEINGCYMKEEKLKYRIGHLLLYHQFMSGKNQSILPNISIATALNMDAYIDEEIDGESMDEEELKQSMSMAISGEINTKYDVIPQPMLLSLYQYLNKEIDGDPLEY